MDTEKTRICHISTVHPPFDDRIFYKECVTLSNSNYEVFLVISHLRDEIIQNINIISLPISQSRAKRFSKSAYIAFRKAYSLKPAIIHIHDPELIVIGIIFRILGKKVIYDVHEDISKQILYKNWIKPTWIRFVVSKIVRCTEFIASKFFSVIVVVTEDIQKNFQISKTILLRNFPRRDMIYNAPQARLVKNRKVVIYSGNLSEVRGIKETVEAIGFVEADLWLIGKWETEEYKASCMKSKGWAQTLFLGEMKLEEVYGYLKHADIGIAMLHPIKNYMTSLPVKAFEYMALGIPMIISDFDYWKEVFAGCALFANPFRTDEIVDNMKLLLENQQICHELGTNALEKIESGCSWEAESQKLITLYKGLLNEN